MAHFSSFDNQNEIFIGQQKCYNANFHNQSKNGTDFGTDFLDALF